MTTVTLTGTDGQVWELNDPASPVQLVGGVGGLHLPKVSNRWQSTARQSGGRYKDSITDSRQFDLTVMVGDPQPPFRTGDPWRDLDARFWSGLRHDDSATLRVNGSRSLTFRLDDDNEQDFAKDPALSGKAVYTISCIADRPEWRGTTTTTTYDFDVDAPSNYYGGGLGPPFTISAPSLNRTAYVSNPGDLPVYPVWTITGPAAIGARVGVADRVIALPFALLAGQQVVIDTEAATIIDGHNGDNLWQAMGSTPLDFAPIPAASGVPIVIGLDSPDAGSAIDITLTPLYRRAW